MSKYLSERKALQIYQRHPVECELDGLLCLLKPRVSYDSERISKLPEAQLFKTDIDLLLIRLEKDGMVSRLAVPNKNQTISFPLYYLTSDGLLWRDQKRYVIEAQKSRAIEKAELRSRHNINLSIIHKWITIASIVLNLLYFFGVIRWTIAGL